MAELITTVLTIAVAVGGVLGTVAYLILLERKLSAWMQDRRGPNRVGPFGVFQPLADGLKFLLKEDLIPAHADKVLFLAAPCIGLLTTLLAFAVVPFGPTGSSPTEYLRFVIAPNVDIGIVFIFAITSLAVYGVILGGWSSNNKYSALGALRASAQVISYEIPLGMSVLGVALLGGTLNLESVVAHQATGGFWSWYIWTQPLAALIFFTSAMAEANRLPFDLSECEQELVGGFHTEYSSMKFALFFLGEYTHVITTSFLTVILFFGGWHFPWIASPETAFAGAWLVKVLVLLAKVFCVIVFIMLIRWTIPRFRFDQLMNLSWKALIPLSLANMLAVMTVRQFGWNDWWLPPISMGLFCGAGIIGVSAKRADIRRRHSAAQLRNLPQSAAAGI